MPSSTSRRSALSPRPITMLRLVELVHLAEVRPRHHDQVRAFCPVPACASGDGDVRVVSSSGSPTRSAAILAILQTGASHDAIPTTKSMHVMTGTSGFSYPAWRGSFYPEKLPEAKMLALLREQAGRGRDQQHLLPDAEAGAARALGRRDAGDVPLRAQEPAQHHAHAAARRRGRRGRAAARRRRARWAIGWGRSCFSCRANLRKDLGVLEAFLSTWPRCRAGCARRSSSATNPGWPTTSTRRCARHDAALCVADSEELATPLVATAALGLPAPPPPGLRRGGAAPVGRPPESAALRRRVRLLQARRRRAPGRPLPIRSEA